MTKLEQVKATAAKVDRVFESSYYDEEEFKILLLLDRIDVEIIHEALIRFGFELEFGEKVED